MTVRWNARAADLQADPVVARSLLSDGRRLALLAAQYAPKRTGDGARSIRAELASRTQEPEVRISWDSDHWYMSQAEFGNEHQTAESFLRRAANEFR